MNVMILATTYLPHIGGLEQVVHHLGIELQRQGHGAVVVTERRPWGLPAAERRDGLQAFRLPFVTLGVSLHGSALYPIAASYARARLRTIARRFQVDVIHLQGVSRNSPYGLALSRALKIPLIATHQGTEVDHVYARIGDPRILQWQQRQLEETAAHAVALTACSSDLAQKLVTLVPPAAAKVSVIENGADPDDLGLPAAVTAAPEEGYIFGVGRFVPKKGFDVLLRAWALLAQQRGAATPHLVLAGDGPERAALEALAAQLGIRAKVRWVGGVSNRKLLGKLFLGCRVCVVPSRQEPFGIVCVEALAAGRPVIASDVGGIPGTVRDGVEGLLVPPDDPVALATALGRVLDGTVSLASPAALRERAGLFSWPTITGRYLELYQNALARPA